MLLIIVGEKTSKNQSETSSNSNDSKILNIMFQNLLLEVNFRNVSWNIRENDKYNITNAMHHAVAI